MKKNFRDYIKKALQNSIKKKYPSDIPKDFLPEISFATDKKFGDYQTNVAMVLAKKLKKSPREIASEICTELEISQLCHNPGIAGAGFINFTLKNSTLGEELTNLIASKNYIKKTNSPKKIVIDFSAPNIAKPMHVGHLRSTIIGDALAKISRGLGHEVITDNHIGDWGTQFGIVIYAWKNCIDKKTSEEISLQELVKAYKNINEQVSTNDEILELCKKELKKLQTGYEENLQIWQKCVEISKESLLELYQRLDVKFDYWLGESFYNDSLEQLVETLLHKKIAQKSEGAICVFFPENEFLADKPCLIKKSDGAFLYSTTDLATIEYRIKNFHPDEIWYVVGAPQSLHFQQIFTICQKQGIKTKLLHIPHGSILGKDKKIMRTRSGENTELSKLLDKAEELASQIIEEKNPKITESDKLKIAKIIGIGAIKYAELSQHRMTDYVFDWDKMLSLNGNTAPYLQYSFVRANSVLKKAKMAEDFFAKDSARINFEINEIEENKLAVLLCQFTEYSEDALALHRPNILANYIYDLARAFHSFYEACPILKNEQNLKENTKNTRIALTYLTAEILEKSLSLLGIKVPEAM